MLHAATWRRRFSGSEPLISAEIRANYRTSTNRNAAEFNCDVASTTTTTTTTDDRRRNDKDDDNNNDNNNNDNNDDDDKDATTTDDRRRNDKDDNNNDDDRRQRQRQTTTKTTTTTRRDRSNSFPTTFGLGASDGRVKCLTSKDVRTPCAGLCGRPSVVAEGRVRVKSLINRA